MALFRSAHDALRFAYNFNGTNVTRTLIGEIPKGTGKGLGGLDGAAEAGNIKRIVCSKGSLVEALVIANFSPHIIPRSISKGWYVSLGWISAIRYLARLTEERCFCGVGDEVYRGKIVAKVFGRERESITDIGMSASVSRATAYRHFKKVKKYILGGRTGDKGIFQKSMELLDEEFSKMGIVGNEDD